MKRTSTVLPPIRVSSGAMKVAFSKWMPSFSTTRVWSAISIHRRRCGSTISSGAALVVHFSAGVIPPRLECRCSAL